MFTFGILSFSASNKAYFTGCHHDNFHGKQLQTIPKDNNKYLVLLTLLMKNLNSFSTKNGLRKPGNPNPNEVSRS
jgi:hypothetical protein